MLVLSQYVERQYASELLADRGGGVGYLLKDRVADVREFMDALARVAAGGTALDPEVVAQLMVSRRRDDRLAALTPREREVLAAMAEGKTNVGIATSLVISEGAAEKHITSILGKLDLPDTENDHRRVLAVLAYLDAGGLTPTPSRPSRATRRPRRAPQAGPSGSTTRTTVGPPGGLVSASDPSSACARSRSPASPPPGAVVAPPTPSSRTSIDERPRIAADSDLAARRPAVLGDVREGLDDDEVRGPLDDRREPLARPPAC